MFAACLGTTSVFGEGWGRGGTEIEIGAELGFELHLDAFSTNRAMKGADFHSVGKIDV